MAPTLLYLLPDPGVSLSDSKKGASIHARAVIHAWLEAGWQVEVLAARGNLEEAHLLCPGAEIELVRQGRWTRKWDRFLKKRRSREKLIYPWMEALHTFLLNRDFKHHLFSWDKAPQLLWAREAWFSWGARDYAAQNDCPFLLEVNALAWKERKLRSKAIFSSKARAVAQKNLEQADLVLTVSEGVRQQVLANGARPDSVLVWPNGVDGVSFMSEPIFPRFSWAQNRFVVGLVASLKPYHGGLRLLQAVDRVRKAHPEVLLWIIGTGPERRALEEETLRLRLGDHVRFEGVVSHHRLPLCLQNMDLTVAPFEGEHYDYMSPLKVLEYMACGRPVLCSRWGHLPEWFVEGEEVLFHEPGNVEDLARWISFAMDHPEKSRTVALQGNRKALERSWAHQVEDVHRTLEKMGKPLPELSSRSREIGLTLQSLRLLFEQRDQQWLQQEMEREGFLAEVARKESAEGLPVKKALDLEKSLPRGRKAQYFLEKKKFNKILAKKWDNTPEIVAFPGPPQGRPMRVMRFVANASAGGVAKVMSQTLLRLNPQEVITRVVVFGPEDDISPRLRAKEGLEFLTKPMQLRLASWDFEVFDNIDRIRALLQEWKPDLVHVHGPTPAPAVLMAASREGIPAAVQLHSMYSKRRDQVHFEHLSVEREAVLRASIIVHGDAVARDLAPYLGLLEHEVPGTSFRTEDGVDDIPLWRETGGVEKWVEKRAQGKRIVFFSARIISSKRIEDFLSAWREISTKDPGIFAVLALYGGEKKPYREQLFRRIRQDFSPDQLEVLYNLGIGSSLIQMADLAVSCSEVEGVPKGILECQKLGVPVVASDIPAHRELIAQEETGLLYPLRDTEALQNAMRRVLRDETLVRGMVEKAQKAVEHRKWQITADQITHIYRSILSGKGPDKKVP